MKTHIELTILLIFLLLPLVRANTYGANKYGCGLYGIGCEEEEEEEEPIAGAGATGAAGARGGGCDVFADEYKRCFHIDPINLTCVEGCPQNYICNENYRCVLKEEIPEEEKIKEGTRTIVLLGIFGGLLGIGLLAEEEKKRYARKRATKKILEEVGVKSEK